MTNTPAEVADKAIDFIEDVCDYPLEPWQATTLRAMLTYPQHSQRKGFLPSFIVTGCTGIHRTMDDLRDCPAHGDRNI
jgi:hypothetical protein